MIRRRHARKVTGLLTLAGAVGLWALSPFRQLTAQRHQEQAPQVYELRRGQAVEFGADPPTVAPFGYKCDTHGNTYVAYSGSTDILSQPGAVSQIPVSKISPDSKKVVRYAVPERILDFDGHVYRYSFDIAPDGRLYALFNTARRQSDGKMEPQFLIGKYKDDGTIDSYLNVGQMSGTRVQPLRMAVFGDGQFLLSGTTVLEKGLGTFAGIFSRDGVFVAPLRLGKPVVDLEEHRDDAPPEKPTKPASHLREIEAQAKNPVSLESSALSFSAQDGNVYLLQGTGEATLYVISAAGKVVRRYDLLPPEPGLSPLQMATAGVGYLFIYYGHVAAGASNENIHHPGIITVLNSETGEVTAVYRMPQEQGGLQLPACAASPDQFYFLGTSKDNHLAVIPYSVR